MRTGLHTCRPCPRILCMMTLVMMPMRGRAMTSSLVLLGVYVLVAQVRTAAGGEDVDLDHIADLSAEIDLKSSFTSWLQSRQTLLPVLPPPHQPPTSTFSSLVSRRHPDNADPAFPRGSSHKDALQFSTSPRQQNQHQQQSRESSRQRGAVRSDGDGHRDGHRHPQSSDPGAGEPSPPVSSQRVPSVPRDPDTDTGAETGTNSDTDTDTLSTSVVKTQGQAAVDRNANHSLSRNSEEAEPVGKEPGGASVGGGVGRILLQSAEDPQTASTATESRGYSSKQHPNHQARAEEKHQQQDEATTTPGARRPASKPKRRRAQAQAASSSSPSSSTGLSFFSETRRVSAKRLHAMELELAKRRPTLPEHRLYHQELLLRRLQTLRRAAASTLPDASSADGWDEELRLRRELAERAAQYGLERKKARVAQPDPQRPLSLMERIHRDAEEILRRRAAQEKEHGKKRTMAQSQHGAGEAASSVEVMSHSDDPSLPADRDRGRAGSAVEGRLPAAGRSVVTHPPVSARQRRKMKQRSRALVRALSRQKRVLM